MDQREQSLRDWLADRYPPQSWQLAPASADASFRRYFRLSNGESSFVVMDAPPAQEDCRPFIDVAGRLAKAGLHVPRIHEQDLSLGFLLLSDLGKTCYFDVLDQPIIGEAYADALGALAKMQARTDITGLPAYDEGRLREELDLFPEWFLNRHLQLAPTDEQRERLEQVFVFLIEACLEQPQVFVHRDYHCRNLMLCKGPAFDGLGNPGIIDFQDAVAGPLVYDLVSLCRDVYVDWPQPQVDAWIRQFTSEARDAGGVGSVSLEKVRRWFNLTAAQRLLKVAGIFARLYYRDGKARYLGDMPLTIKHLFGVCASEPELEPLTELLQGWGLPEALRQVQVESSPQ